MPPKKNSHKRKKRGEKHDRPSKPKKEPTKDTKFQRRFRAMITDANESAAAITKSRLILEQKSLQIESCGLFNHGKKSDLVTKLTTKKRMNKARHQGNLLALLDGPRNLEANKENIPPRLPPKNSQFKKTAS